MADAALRTKQVLIVDDEPAVLGVLEEFFKNFRHDHAYAVQTASNGTDAYVAFLRARPDLVLLDMNMPGMDGLQLLKQMRALDARVPIMMVTANENTRAAGEAQTAGVSAYVPKPFDFRRLDMLVSLVLSSPRGPAGGAATR